MPCAAAGVASAAACRKRPRSKRTSGGAAHPPYGDILRTCATMSASLAPCTCSTYAARLMPRTAPSLSWLGGARACRVAPRRARRSVPTVRGRRGALSASPLVGEPGAPGDRPGGASSSTFTQLLVESAVLCRERGGAVAASGGLRETPEALAAAAAASAPSRSTSGDVAALLTRSTAGCPLGAPQLRTRSGARDGAAQFRGAAGASAAATSLADARRVSASAPSPMLPPPRELAALSTPGLPPPSNTRMCSPRPRGSAMPHTRMLLTICRSASSDGTRSTMPPPPNATLCAKSSSSVSSVAAADVVDASSAVGAAETRGDSAPGERASSASCSATAAAAARGDLGSPRLPGGSASATSLSSAARGHSVSSEQDSASSMVSTKSTKGARSRELRIAARSGTRRRMTLLQSPIGHNTCVRGA